METLNISTLDAYSRPIAKGVSRRWPEFKKYGKVVKKKGKTYWILEIPSPKPNPETGITLTVGDGVNYLEFENDILHVDDYLDMRPMVAKIVIDFIEWYLNEELISVSWWQGGKLRVSTLQAPDETISKDSSLKGQVTCRVRSWSGRFDRDVVQR